MPTVEIVQVYRDLVNRPTIDRHTEYVIQRIENELARRLKRAVKLVK